jgi:pimeloyl-ACP methyl ester carboxylesterase
MSTAISRDGTPIAYERLGAGPPVILVDGAFCSRRFGPMPKLAPLLARRFTVFMYDRRGRGASGDTRPYAKEREVEDIAALIATAGGEAAVYGCSSGAALALEAAASGLPISRLALYEPPYMVLQDGRHPPKDHRQRLERLVDEGRRGEAVKFFMKDVIGLPGPMVTMMRIMPMWSGLKDVAHTLAYDAAVMGDYSLPADRAAAIRVPTLVMDGEKTDPRLRASVAAVSGTVPNARRRSLKGQTHNVSAAAMAPMLEEFFGG